MTLATAVMDVGSIYSEGHPIVTGDMISENADGSGQTYQVLYAVDSDNPLSGYPDNGFQAMAVAPIKNGRPDTQNIIIAFAATNANGTEPNDLLTDFETVVGGLDYLNDGAQIVPAQPACAVRFTDAVTAAYPDAQLAFTGISLGGYLSLYMGAVTEKPVMAFEGPDPSNILTPAQIAYVKAHPESYFDVRSTWDMLLGAYGGNGLADSVFYDAGFEGLLGSHWPTRFTFGSDGSITTPLSPVVGPIVNSIVTSIDPMLALVAKGTTGAMDVVTTYAPPAIKIGLKGLVTDATNLVYQGLDLDPISKLISGPVNAVIDFFSRD